MKKHLFWFILAIVVLLTMLVAPTVLARPTLPSAISEEESYWTQRITTTDRTLNTTPEVLPPTTGTGGTPWGTILLIALGVVLLIIVLSLALSRRPV